MFKEFADLSSITESAVSTALKAGFLSVGVVLTLTIGPVLYFIFGEKRFGMLVAGVGVVFVALFGLVNFVETIRPDFFPPRENVIIGKMTNLDKDKGIYISTNDEDVGEAYIKSINNARRETKDYHFVFLTSAQPSCLLISITPNPEDKSPFWEKYRDGLEFDVDKLFEGNSHGRTRIHANLIDKTVDGKEEKIVRIWRYDYKERRSESYTDYHHVEAWIKGCEGEEKSQERKDQGVWRWGSSAYAQQSDPVDLNDIKSQLSSDDVLERRNARAQLAKRGPVVVGALGPLFEDDSNYRVQLGIAVAIARMPPGQRKELPSKIVEKLQELSQNSDRTMRDTAIAALNGIPTQ